MDDQPFIKVSSVTKYFGQPQGGVLALRNVSLDVRRGEFLSIIGPSGCGKSTLLRMVADLLAPSEGEISIAGRSPAEARLGRAYGIVFQSPTLMEWRSVSDNIKLPLEILGTDSSERDRRAAELLALLRLADFGARYPRELSSGMQQQISIARALAYRPSILLMDEPFGALDELTRERLGNELLEMWEQLHVTVVFVTHSVSEAVLLSDRVAVLSPRPGHVEQVITIDIPRPRAPAMRDTQHFIELVRSVRAALHLDGKGKRTR